MEESKISVVIPIYKVEKYLKRCVDSVCRQTYSNLEIILVDDGSPDRCPEICDKYAQNDGRIKVIHKLNGGLASARNTGMKEMSGKYLFFLDSDDWLEQDGLEKLYRIAEKYHVDFVRYRAIRSGWPGQETHAACRVEEIRELEEGLYDRERIIKEIYPRLLATSQLTMGAIVGAWGSLYNVDFLKKNNLKFYEDVKFSEDLIFSANVVRAAESFYFVDQPGVYHYYYNPSSISKSFREGRWESCKSLISCCERDFSNCKEYDFSNELVYLKWFCLLLALNERKYFKKYCDKYNYCKKIVSEDAVNRIPLNMRLMDISWKQKIVLIIVKLKISGILALI